MTRRRAAFRARCEEAHGYKTESVCRRYAIVAEAITGVNKGESELHL